MSKKVLVPVFPSDTFYDAVIRASDILVDEGGLIVFAFTKIRPTPDVYDAEASGSASAVDIEVDAGDLPAEDVEHWKQAQVAGLEDARQLLYDRGIREAQIDYH